MHHRCIYSSIIILTIILTACIGPAPAATPTLAEPTASPTTPLATIPNIPPATPTSTPVPSPLPLLPTPTPGGPLTRLSGWGGGITLDATYLPKGAGVVLLRPSALELHPTTPLAELRWRVALARIPTALAVTPDAQTIAVSSGSGVDLYASADGTHQGTIPGLGAPINAIAISPDGRLLAAAQADQVIALWDIAERSILSELRLPFSEDGMLVPGTFTSVAFSPDGQYVAAGDDAGNIGVWARSDGVAIQTLSVGVRVVTDVAFSPDSRSVAAASEGWRSEPGAVWIWDVASGAELHWLGFADDSRFLAPAQRLAFSLDGGQVLMGLADGALLRWNLADTSLTQELLGHSAAITALAFADDGAILSAARDGSVRTWHPDGTPAETLTDTGAITALMLSSDGRLVISGDAGGMIDLRQRDGKPVVQIPSPGGAITALALSPDATILASASNDGRINLWQVPSGAALGELMGHTGPTEALAFHPNGMQLASGGHDGTLRLWRVGPQAVERLVPILQTDGLSATIIYQIAFSADGQIIATAGNEDAISLWRSADLTRIEQRSIPNLLPCVQVTFSPNGTLIARTYNGQIYAWDQLGAAIPLLKADVNHFNLLADTGMVTLSAGSFHIWHGSIMALERYATAPAPGFSQIAATPDTIALGSPLGQIEVWSVR